MRFTGYSRSDSEDKKFNRLNGQKFEVVLFFFVFLPTLLLELTLLDGAMRRRTALAMMHDFITIINLTNTSLYFEPTFRCKLNLVYKSFEKSKLIRHMRNTRNRILNTIYIYLHEIKFDRLKRGKYKNENKSSF